MQTKAATQWTPSDLEVAAQLAACRADIERLRRELAVEGDIVENAINKKHVLLDMFFKRQVALSRILQVDALSTQGQRGHQAKKNEVFQDAKKLHAAHADNTLIPMRR